MLNLSEVQFPHLQDRNNIVIVCVLSHPFIPLLAPDLTSAKRCCLAIRWEIMLRVSIKKGQMQTPVCLPFCKPGISEHPWEVAGSFSETSGVRIPVLDSGRDPLPLWTLPPIIKF